MKKIFLSCVALTSALLAACNEQATDTHPQQLVTKRVAIFKKLTKTLEPMGLVARDRQAYVKADFVAQAQALQELSGQPWAFFTADGDYPPTRAKHEVWTHAAEFKKAQDDYLASVNKLVGVAGSADLPSIKDSVEAVQKSCKSCHDQFRSDTARGK